MKIQILTVASIIILCSTGFWLCFIHENKKSGINHILAITLFIIAYSQFVQLGLHCPCIQTIAVNLTYTDAIVFYLLMPLFYILLFNIIEEHPILSSLNAKRLWPSLSGLVFSIYFSTLSGTDQEQVSMGNHCGVLPDCILYIIGSCSIIFYLFLSIRLVINHINHNRGKLARQSLKQLQAYVWILYICLLLCFCFIILSIIASSVLSLHNIFLSLLLLVSEVFLFVVFFVKPRPLEYIDTDKHQELMNSVLKNTEQIEVLARQLEHIMQKKRLFLNPDLDMKELAEKTEIPEYKISSIVREHYSMSVPDYINRHRVDYAKQCLSELNSASIKIDFLVLECGFSSRSNFYNTFKRYTGYTPQEFRESLYKS